MQTFPAEQTHRGIPECEEKLQLTSEKRPPQLPGGCASANCNFTTLAVKRGTSGTVEAPFGEVPSECTYLLPGPFLKGITHLYLF